MSLRGIIDMIAASWWQVKATTIKKCFEKAGFVRDAITSGADNRVDADDETIDADDVYSQLVESSYNSTWKRTAMTLTCGR